jgi:hypothetical protein
MTNPLYTIDTLPTTSQAFIREFDDRYIAALGAASADGWSDKLGELIPTAVPMITFPLSQLRTKYKRTQGESRFKTLGEKSFDIKTEEFDDGYQAALSDLFQKVFAYRLWQKAPGRFLEAEALHREHSIAALLEVGESTAFLDTGKNFFSATHFANLFDDSAGNFSNYQATPKDVVSIANLEAEVTAFKDVRDENGDKLSAKPDIILCPTEKSEPLKNLLKKEMIASVAGTASETNPYMNGFTVVEVPQFTDVNDWYLVDSKMVARGLTPWISMRQNMPSALALRVYDESSDFFKDTGNLKISSHIWYGFSLALPHAIRKIKGA